MFAVVLIVLNGINLANFAGHAKIGNLADTHFVDQDVLQLDIAVDVAHSVMHVLETSDDLPKHGAYVVVRKGGTAVALEDVKQGAFWAVLGDEEIGVGGMFGFEEGEDVLVVERGPDLGFVI